MDVKKSGKPVKSEEHIETDIVIENVETDTPAKVKANNKKPSVKKAVDKPDGFCVYIGPSIRGVIQSGTIYGKSLKDTKAFLASAIERYPLIAKLISTEKTITEDRIKVKTAGNLLNVYYVKLASGKSN